LPESAQEEYIKAKYEDGILKLEIPREKELDDQGKPRKVLIQ
jgi:HSP20 family molecular chaperone IbpA